MDPIETTQPYLSSVTVEATGCIHREDWSTYVEIRFNQDLSTPLIEALQNGEHLTVTFAVRPKA